MRGKDIKKIPNCLSKYRRQKGFTQKEVARILGFKQSSIISKWENGVSLPSTTYLLKLSVLYGRPTEALFTDLYKRIKEDIFAALDKKSYG